MENLATLTLADGKTYGVAAADPASSSMVAQLIQAMQLKQGREPDWLLLVKVDGDVERLDIEDDQHAQTPSETNAEGAANPSRGMSPLRNTEADVEVMVCPAKHIVDGDVRAVQLMRMSQAVVKPAWNEGALLVHGALIERDGWGVLLAGPGGVGKSTASKRIPSPWRAICDDSALVVRDGQGAYWAHPWPTWSDFMYGGKGGRWDVGYAVQLKAIFFLEQAAEEAAEPVGVGKAICLLLESVGQAMQASMFKMDKIEKRALNLQRFENVTELMKNIPAYRLGLSKTGAFWAEIEGVLKDNSGQHTADSKQQKGNSKQLIANSR